MKSNNGVQQVYTKGAPGLNRRCFNAYLLSARIGTSTSIYERTYSTGDIIKAIVPR